MITQIWHPSNFISQLRLSCKCTWCVPNPWESVLHFSSCNIVARQDFWISEIQTERVCRGTIQECKTKCFLSVTLVTKITAWYNFHGVITDFFPSHGANQSITWPYNTQLSGIRNLSDLITNVMLRLSIIPYTSFESPPRQLEDNTPKLTLLPPSWTSEDVN